jgi:dTDP-4-dehydrorhamnose reductase
MQKVKFPEGTIVFGGSGMTGFYISDDVPNYDLSDGFDISEERIVKAVFEKENPKYVLLLAAQTDVATLQKEPVKTFMHNTIGAYWVAFYCRKYKAKLLFISTVDIFDGNKEEGYEVKDEPNPIVVYGHSKLAAEHIIRGLCPEAVIFRASWMFGGFDRDKKFPMRIVKRLKENLPAFAVTDRVGSPTSGFDIIQKLAMAIDKNMSGTYHIACEGRASRYDQALVIGEVWGLKHKVFPVKEEFFPEFRSLPFAVLKPSKEFNIIKWDEAMREYVKEWKSEV